MQPYWGWVYLAIGLFLFFKVFGIHKKMRKRFHDFWEDLFLSKLEYCLLEIKIPQALEKTPLGMEQVFAGLHGTARGVTKFEVEIKGYLERSYSLEIASFEGKIHFYVRTEREYRTTVEALIYAQFPEVEVQEVEDYVQDAPKILPNKNIKLAAGELVLEKSDPYPIKSYEKFEFKAGREAEYVIDPFAGIMEAMNSLEEGEEMWLHYVIGIPMLRDWRKEGEAMVDKLMGRNQSSGGLGIIRRLIHEILGFTPHFSSRLEHLAAGGQYKTPEGVPLEETKKESGMEMGLWKLSPGERELVEAIEKNISKFGFYTMIRFAYFAPRDVFSVAKAGTLLGAFYQFNDRYLNSFTVNSKLGYSVKKPYFWNYFMKYLKVNYYLFWKHKRVPWKPEVLQSMRMSEIYKYFQNRGFGKPDRGHKGMLLNTEELATIFHFPMRSVLTPELPKVEAKRGGPPACLPSEE